VSRLCDSLGRIRHRGALLFVSVLIHSLLVLIPWQKKSRPRPDPPTPANPISVVDASQLPKLPIPDSQLPDSQQLPVVLAEPSIPPPAPVVEVLPPVVSPAPLPLPPEKLVIEERVVSTDGPMLADPPNSESTPTPSTTPAETSPTTPAVTPPNAAKIAADWENFVGHLQLQDGGLDSSNLLQIFNIFATPGQTDQFFYKDEDENGNRQPKLNVLYEALFSEQTPEQILETVVRPGFSSDTSFNLQRQENFPIQENFPAGSAYQLLQGSVLRYLIIVQFNEHNDSVLILSESLPEGLTAE